MSVQMSQTFDDASCSQQDLFTRFETSDKGLSDQKAKERLEKIGPNEPSPRKKRTIAIQFLEKFLNPLVVVLLVITVFSYFFGEKVSAVIVGMMALISVVLSFVQEYRAGKEVERLNELVRTNVTVIRSGRSRDIPIREIVPGDLIDLFAGDIIPADVRIIQAKDLFINQSALTGESLPVEKIVQPAQTKGQSLTELPNMVFMGSSVVSGTGLGVVLRTGGETQFGEIARKLANVSEATSFDKGIQQFTWLMIHMMLVLVIGICAINFLTKGNFIQALLFSLAVAVGLTPEMLPMLVTLNLSKGAIAMSKKEVIVKRLTAIQNFGAMDILCTDKTGTLTLDKIVLEKYCDVVGQENKDVLMLAYINSFYQTGLKSILDKAVLKYEKLVVNQYVKADEIPFDFSRRIMSVIVQADGKHRMITKGAPEEVFKRCSLYELDGELIELDRFMLADLKEEYDALSSDGFRVLAVAYKDLEINKESYSKDDEQSLILKGYIAFLDPPKPTSRKAIEVLKSLGVELKVLTGDNELVTKKICTDVGLDVKGLLNGEQLEKLSDEEFRRAVRSASVLVRLSPVQKERVIRALRDSGQTVGFMGDGINDALALKAADVGISVNNATDIAKESADIILLQKSLLVLRDGILEGRKTFGNILKYIKMGSSSNFGNMLSMTGASIILPFLPMLPIQILLNNFLYDLSQVAIASDHVDEEYLLKPRPWGIDYIKKYMVILGCVSSIFDFITFGVLIFIFHATASFFHTGWFLVSIFTQTLVIHIIRTGKVSFLQSMPSQFLIFTSIYMVTIATFLPYTPLGAHFGFVILPASYFVALALITAGYLWSVQSVKNWFINKYGY